MKTNDSKVTQLAYQLWENAGRPSGRDLEFWLAAEKSLRAPAKQSITQSAKPVAAEKAPKGARAGTRKSWPKPYPALPRF